MSDVARFWGITWYELKMRWRSAGYWIVTLLVNAYALFVSSPLNYGSPEDLPFFRSSWWMAGQSFTAATTLMSGLSVFLVANSILRDRTLRTEELLRARGGFPGAYVMGKWTASLVALGFAVVPLFVGGPFTQWHVGRMPAQPGPFLLAFATIYLPTIVFVTTLALSATTLLGDQRLFYVPYLVVWYFDSFQFWVPRPAIREVVNFSGASALLRLFLSRFPERAARYPKITTGELLCNAGILLLSSLALLVVLHRKEARAWTSGEAVAERPA